MTLIEDRFISYEDLLKLREETDDKVELIDNVVYMTPAPTPIHQKICFKVAKILDGYAADKNCQMLQGVNVRLYDEQQRKIGDVIPDISIFCQYKDLNVTFIDDTPAIIVEIVSPSTVYADNIKKADLYKRAGVKEYWIIDPKSKVITVWNFNTDEQMIYREIAHSYLFEGLSIELEYLFT